MSRKRIVFMGTPEFAVASLDALVKDGCDIVAVVTVPDKPAGRGRQPTPSAVKQYALEQGLHILQPASLRDDSFVAALRELNADIFVVVAFRMLPEVVWTLPPLGTINLHGSLLPQYRGAAPIHRAVMNGEETTGVTTFFIRQEIDTGDIIMQRSMTIGQDETTGEVHDRMKLMGAQVLVETIHQLESGLVKGVEQEKLVTDAVLHPAPKIFRDDCKINFSRPSFEVHNFIRGLSPFPGAWFTAEGKQFKVYRSQPTQMESPGPGVIKIEDRHHWLIGCSTGCIELLEVQPEGKKRMKTEEFLRGVQETPGRVDD